MKKQSLGVLLFLAALLVSTDAFPKPQAPRSASSIGILPSATAAPLPQRQTPRHRQASRIKKKNNRPASAYLYYRDSEAGATVFLLPASPAPFPVAYFVPSDPYYRGAGHIPSQPLLDDLWGVKLLNMENAWNFTKGSGVIVAVVDSGVHYSHNDISSNIWTNLQEVNGTPGVDDDGNGYLDDIRGWDFSDDDNDPDDPQGHGSIVAGIIGALGNNNRGTIGIAPEVRILPVRVLDAEGSGYWSDVAEGVRYAADQGAKVINLSLGQIDIFPAEGTLISNAIAYAKAKGAIVVVSAGNGDEDGNALDIGRVMPARLSSAISVGALRHAYDTDYGSGPLSRADFSNYGSELDFMAPGVDILSIYYDEAGNDSSTYAVGSGTSMSAPIVTGLVALMLAQDPLATFDDIYRRLRYSSIDMGAAGFDVFYGYGRVDAFRALSYDYFADGVVKTYRLAQPDNTGAVRYDYFPSSHQDTTTFANGSVYKYYDASQRLRSVLDAQANFVEFYDDVFGANGGGRLSRAVLSNGMDYRYTAYWEDTATAKTLVTYQYANLVSTQDFYATGGLKKIAYPNGSYFTQYEFSHKIQSYRDAAGNTIDYLDDPTGNNPGRFTRFVLADGREYRFTYWFISSKFKTIEHLLSGGPVWTKEYYESGNPQRHTDFASGDVYEFFDETFNRKSTSIGATGVTYLHRNENWLETHTGRYTRITEADGSYQLRTAYWGDETLAAGDDTDHVRWVSFYNSSDELQATVEFDPSGNPISPAATELAAKTSEPAASTPSDSPQPPSDRVYALPEALESRLEMHGQLDEERKTLAGERAPQEKIGVAAVL